MSSIDKVASELRKIIMEPSKSETKPFDSEATITRIDGSTAWVHFPGGVDETPVTLTIDAKPGDVVNVHVENSRGWISGNSSAPPTDDSAAMYALNSAERARKAADKAELNAQSAITSATRASRAADIAEVNAQTAISDAASATSAANSAQASATSAMKDLSLVEKVVDSVNWIAKHGYYVLTSDTTVIVEKVYYNITANAIDNPTGNPSMNLYYVRTGSGTEESPYIYVKSEDESVVSGTTYYSVLATVVGSPEENPNANLYYELAINEAVSQYINTILSLTNDGLWVQSASDSAWKQLIKPNGIDIWNGGVVASYSDDIRLGRSNAYVRIASTVMQFYLYERVMALFGYDNEFESYGLRGENVMIKGAGNALRLDNDVNGTNQGQYILETRANGHLSLKPGLRREEEE